MQTYNNNNKNNKHFFNLQVANSPSRLRFEANLSRESVVNVQSTVKDQMSQINTGGQSTWEILSLLNIYGLTSPYM